MKKKNINSKILYFTAFIAVLVMGGCESYLDQEPQDQLSETVYFQSAQQFENAANYFYTRLGFEDGDEASDLSNNFTPGETTDLARGGISTPTSDSDWDNNYTYLRAPNQLIEKAAEYEGDPSEIAASVGTAYFFRAWHHFKLLRKFGGVPIVTSSLDVSAEVLYAPRNSRYEVVYQILADLDEAIAKLPTANTVEQGMLSTEAAKAFKARICLYEGTWDKYVGTETDGDGSSKGAGSAKPSGYPSVNELLTEAKNLASQVMTSGAFELWDHREDIGDDHLFYLFTLEDAGSNPAGLTKADNKEFIFQTVYDFTLGQIRQNISHSKPWGPTRKLMDMYLAADGLPVQHSAVFEGYDLMTSEFRNRDMRLTSFVKEPLVKYWGHGSSTDGGGAQYGVDFEDSGVEFDYRYVPQLGGPGGGRGAGYEGRKFVTEYRLRETREESFNYPLIRYAEVLLIYAEATCELNGGTIDNSDLDKSINLIRERSGVAPLSNELIAPYSDLTMLGEIRRERAIELFGENFRFDDLKRWGIAADELNMDVCLNYVDGTEFETAENPKDPGSLIYQEDGWSYGTIDSEQSSSTYAGIANTKEGALILDPTSLHTWSYANYLSGIPTDEITLNPELKQNPGW
ncbi:RagB/SusD family nutrient uptake outer membrane protein [uncultured Draconibacterium sp.]|uniref:RagB/SusD family nutrient uptake outer membrane protein n=1 Tax=uncultured Draconibacterium sp. TaxID=1573823 RepID=UPI0029C82748|nr:RagB/SusD family nutrient uptake outer membrane protein [uncultured Draconibacterium sp.]